MPKIITRYDPPPIPMRQFDWSAIFDDYDAGEIDEDGSVYSTDPIGYGHTEQEAIADLLSQVED